MVTSINGILQKKSKQGGLRIYFFENSLEFFYFNPGSSRQNKAQPLDIAHNCVRSIGKSEAKNQSPGNATLLFLITLGNSTLFLINLWKFHMLFIWYPWKFHIHDRLVWIFSGIAQSQFNSHHSQKKRIVWKHGLY